MTLHILEDNKTLFKYSIDDFKFTHYNTTNEDGTTNDGRQLSEKEKKNKIKESLKYIENLKATEGTIKNILDETEKEKEKENERAELHLFKIINDNKTLFKFSIGDSIFTHNNKDGRRLTEEEKNQIIKEKLFIMMTLKHGLNKINSSNII